MSNLGLEPDEKIELKLACLLIITTATTCLMIGLVGWVIWDFVGVWS